MEIYELFKAQVFCTETLPLVETAIKEVAERGVFGVFNFAVIGEPAIIVPRLLKALEAFGTVKQQELRKNEKYYYAVCEEEFIQASYHVVLDGAEPTVWVHFGVFLSSPAIFNR